MQQLEIPLCADIDFYELTMHEVVQIRGMRKMLSNHLGDSPCFMYSSPQDYDNWLARAETRSSRIFVARNVDKLIAFIEIAEGSAENFATEVNDMRNICGAFCLPEYRGKGIIQGLMNHIISILKDEGYERLGVDFESFNPTANGFWLKHFTAYTNSLVRRIDECAIKK